MASGDGYVTLVDGTQRWGLFGAAGVLLSTLGANSEPLYFVAKRSSYVHLGGTWGVPGGALHEHEAALAGALRELAEETGHLVADFTTVAEYIDDHGIWFYRTFLLQIAQPFEEPAILNWETDEVRWVSRDELARLELFDAFRRMLSQLEVLS